MGVVAHGGTPLGFKDLHLCLCIFLGLCGFCINQGSWHVVEHDSKTLLRLEWDRWPTEELVLQPSTEATNGDEVCMCICVCFEGFLCDCVCVYVCVEGVLL